MKLKVVDRTSGGANLQDVQNELQTGAALLWDATNGRVLIEDVTFIPANVLHTPTVADITLLDVVDSNGPAAGSPSPGGPGSHIQFFWDKMQAELALDEYELGYSTVHELGHYLFALGDEYPQGGLDCNLPTADPGLWATGECFHQGMDVFNNCVMQDKKHGTPPYTQTSSEFCHQNNHDGLHICSSSSQPEATEQYNRHNGEACWQTIVRAYPTLGAAPLTTEVLPPMSGYVPALFHDQTQSPDGIMLVLDTSCSMREPTDGPRVPGSEYCDNDRNDDGDTQTDESPCLPSRMTWLLTSLNAFADLLEERRALGTSAPVELGIVSFDAIAREELPMTAFGVGTRAALDPVIDGLKYHFGPATNLALGMSEAWARYTPTQNKTMMIFSDGLYNAGADPVPLGESIRDDGVWIDVVGDEDFMETGFVTSLELQRRPGPAFQNDDRPGARPIQFFQRFAGWSGWYPVVPAREFFVNDAGAPICLFAWASSVDGTYGPDSACGTGGSGTTEVEIPLTVAPDDRYFRILISQGEDSFAPLDIELEFVDATGLVHQAGSVGSVLSSVGAGPHYALHTVSLPASGPSSLVIRNGASRTATRVMVSIFGEGEMESVTSIQARRLEPGAVFLSMENSVRDQLVADFSLGFARLVDPTGTSVSIPLEVDYNGRLEARIDPYLSLPGWYEVQTTATSPGSAKTVESEIPGVKRTPGEYVGARTWAGDVTFHFVGE